MEVKLVLKNKLLSIQIKSNISDELIALFKSKIKERYELNFKKFNKENDFILLNKIYNEKLIQVRVLYKETASNDLIKFCEKNNIRLIIEDFSKKFPQKECFASKGYICACKIFIDENGTMKYGSCDQRKFEDLKHIKSIHLVKQICNQEICKGVNILYLEKNE